MSEFLKNNPIALRHCLLYEFLQEKPVEEAFTDFCEAVGKKVIKKKKFQCWFDQFKQGKFDENQKPITDLKEILRSDKKALRACVMYETLTKPSIYWGDIDETNEMMVYIRMYTKPVTVLDKHKNLCEVIGEDAMEYREFDFWFYRFGNGEYELDFEKDKDKKVYELMEMPIDVMRNIVKYSDIFDRLALMRTSRSLQTFVKDQKLLNLDLYLTIRDNRVEIEIGREINTIIYYKNGDDCFKQFKRGDKNLVRGVSYLKQALQDFKQIIEYPKLHLDTLSIFLNNVETETEWTTVFDLIWALKLNHQLPVKIIEFKTWYLKPLLNFLSCFKPGYLTTIDIRPDPDADVMNELFEMEQWKQAKYLTTHYTFVSPRHHLYHFKKFNVCYEEFHMEDIRQMKEILFKSPNFERCVLNIQGTVDMDAIKQEFGDIVEGSTELLYIWKYLIPNSTECVIIQLQKWFSSFCLRFEKQQIEC